MSETDGFVIEDRPEGRTLIVTGAWTLAAQSAVGRDDVDGLWLNYARGFSGADLEFLEAVPVRRLLVLDHRVSDLTPIERLSDTLEDLSVQAAPGAVVDLTAFPRLKCLSSTWRAVRETIADASALVQLVALEYDEWNLSALAQNRRLAKLVLKPADELRSLTGLASLSHLEHFGVFAAPNLDDLAELTAARSLRHLELQSCASVDALDVVAGLAMLEFLGVSDCGQIRSLAPLSLLEKLEVLHAWGSTRIEDADLSPLARLPKLSEVRMRDRREYQPRPSKLTAWKT